MPSDFENAKEILAKNVKKYRRAKGFSQEELAFEADIDRTYVSQIERCLINPSLLVLCKLGAALGISLTQLFNQ